MQMLQTYKTKFLEFQKKHERRLEILFFVGGFAFDAILASELDLFALIQQATYLLVIALFLQYEVLFRLHKWRPSGVIEKIWAIRNLILHFLLGTLLNVYSIFYIKSASVISSLVFLALMVSLIIANETHLVKGSKVSLKIALFAICLFSYISILFPMILGFVGWVPLSLATATTIGIFYLQIRILRKKLPDEKTLLKVFFYPSVSVLVIFILFYVMGWIPPVPLSVKEQGVYHLVEKQNGEYILSSEKVWWKFWQSGDQDFKAQPQDKIYFYSQIYSPARFSDQVFVQWFWKDPIRGWQNADRIPLKISGGRKEGFRGFAVKSNYQVGEWRVVVETSIGQEISRLNFDVSDSPVGTTREFKIEHR